MLTRDGKAKPSHITHITWFAAALCILCFFLAYLPSLGSVPLRYNNDEGRRALVTAEMMLSGDYITPTINGEIYLNKPPLYNWIVAGWFHLFDDYSMFAFRLPVILAIALTGLAVFLFTKKYTNTPVAFFTAFAFMTNGRILVFDSFSGLIDTSFTLLVYLQFMFTFHYGEKRKYWQLFLLTYLLTAAGFLMKGMPALVFQALTLLTYFLWRSRFRVLLGFSHLAGILLLVLVTGIYYFAYFRQNDISPLEVFSNLLSESSKRTPGHFSIGRTLWHLLTFPLEMLYHYAPWTLFFIVFLHRDIRRKIKKNPFIHYSLLVFAVNFPVYWISPEVYPRYLFMFLPLLFSAAFFVYFHAIKPGNWQYNVVYAFTVFLCGALAMGALLLPFSGWIKAGMLPRILFLSIVFAYLLWMTLRHRELHLYSLLLAILVFRVAFGWFVMPERAIKPGQYRERAEKIVSFTSGKPLYILRGSNIGNFDGMSFHIATGRGQVLSYRNDVDTSAFYITDKAQSWRRAHDVYFRFPNYYAPDSLLLVKFR